MTRRCSHCSNNGHNSRTCPSSSSRASHSVVKLFGVRLTDGSIIKKSASMGNLSALHYLSSSSSAAASPNTSSPSPDTLNDGYLSDDPAHSSCTINRHAERKKGVPWTEEEHRLFLLGLGKLGKGDWRGISRNFVVSRTPTQVASHAQKYFIRQTNGTRRKRRSSLFDMNSDLATDAPPVVEEQPMLPAQVTETDKMNREPSLKLSLKTDYEPMEDTPNDMAEDFKESVAATEGKIPPIIPSFVPAYLPVTFPLWSSNAVPVLEHGKGTETSRHEILKPVAMLCKEPVKVDEPVGLSRLSIGDTDASRIEASSLSVKLLGASSRQSAFHLSTPVSSSDVDKGSSSVSQAV